MARPWEEAPLRPWETQQSIYIRTISVTRPASQLGAGDEGYLGLNRELSGTTIATGLAATIQSSREVRAPLGKTPSDADTKAQWNIYLPPGAVAAGVIQDRDIATDDLGRSFMITASDPTAMGYRLRAELLEA